MEKKIECEIVQDLLLGYVDDTINNESKKLVEKHLLECEECQKRLEMIKNDIEDSNEMQNKEIDYLKNIRKKVNKKNKIVWTLGIALILGILLNVIVFANYFLSANSLQIYLNNDITEEQIESIIQTIRNEDNEAEIVYYSKEDELEKMKENLGEKAYLLDGYEEQEKNVFPASLVVTTKFSKLDNIEYLCLSIDGIKSIQNEKDNNPYILFLDWFDFSE